MLLVPGAGSDLPPRTQDLDACAWADDLGARAWAEDLGARAIVEDLGARAIVEGSSHSRRVWRVENSQLKTIFIHPNHLQAYEKPHAHRRSMELRDGV